LGLGPKADSLADNFIELFLLLNKLKPATYFSVMILLGLGNFILLQMSYIKSDIISIMRLNLFE